MKESQSETLRSEEIKRSRIIDIAEKEGEGSKAGIVYWHVIRRDEGASHREGEVVWTSESCSETWNENMPD
jgi:hypothetical protein